MTKLALFGGTPVRAKLLPYGRQLIDEADIEAVANVLRSDWLTTGPMISEFESAFAETVGAKHAVAVSNGTAALHAAAFAAGIDASTDAIVPAMTFAASANCIRYQNGRVVFADVRPDTLTVDPAAVEAALTPNTRAIVAVDFAGQAADLDELIDIAHDHGSLVIEDAAHALGGLYRGRRVGSIADLTTFSLHPVKQITTGEGGVVTTNDPGLAARLRRFRNHGITTDHRQRETAGSWVYEMVDLGYNYRITDFQSALGRSQLRKLGNWLARRAAIADLYSDGFRSVPEIQPLARLADRVHAWHLYVVQLDLQRLKADRKTIFQALRAENVGINVHYIPVPWHPYYRSLGYAAGGWPVAEEAYERMLTLPLWPGMTDDDVRDVVTAVEKVIEYYRA